VQVIAWNTRPRSDLLCVQRDVKLYSLIVAVVCLLAALQVQLSIVIVVCAVCVVSSSQQLKRMTSSLSSHCSVISLVPSYEANSELTITQFKLMRTTDRWGPSTTFTCLRPQRRSRKLWKSGTVDVHRGEGACPSLVMGVRGCYPRKIFENIGADLCNYVHFWWPEQQKMYNLDSERSVWWHQVYTYINVQNCSLYIR